MSGRDVYSLSELQALAFAAARDLYGDGDPWAGPGRAWAAYKASGFELINARLRDGAPWSNDDQARLAMFMNWRLKKDAVLFRGIGGVGGSDPFRALEPGDIYVESAYLSTSYVKRHARKFGGRGGYLITIIAPKQAAFVAPDFPGDESYLRNREMTFPPGCQLFILAIDPIPGRQTQMDAVLFPPKSLFPPTGVDLLALAESEWENWNVPIES